MTIRRRLVVAVIVIAALGLVTADLVTWTQLRSYLYGRADQELTQGADQGAFYLYQAARRGIPVHYDILGKRVVPDIAVMLIGPGGKVIYSRAAGLPFAAQPLPRLPKVLPVRPLAAPRSRDGKQHGRALYAAYHPLGYDFDVPARTGGAPPYRSQAVAVPGGVLVVASSLGPLDATLSSLATTELAVTLGLLVLLALATWWAVRLGLRPLDQMTSTAEEIAVGQLHRRVREGKVKGEVARLATALNAMLGRIEHAVAEQHASEGRLRQFIADASHELRTPVTAIQGYAELFRRGALEDPASRARATSAIEHEALRMGKLVDELLLLARLDQGRPLEHMPVDLSLVARQVVEDAMVSEAPHPVSVSATEPAVVMADEHRLYQLVGNLVRNAFQHTPTGTPIAISVRTEGAMARLAVSDQGPGISASDRAHIFDRFYRGSGARSNARSQGSGLGLPIVAAIAQAMGGRAMVANGPGATNRPVAGDEAGQGARFEVVLPLAGAGTLPERSGD